jgi:hypothetical protein
MAWHALAASAIQIKLGKQVSARIWKVALGLAMPEKTGARIGFTSAPRVHRFAPANAGLHGRCRGSPAKMQAARAARVLTSTFHPKTSQEISWLLTLSMSSSWPPAKVRG